MSTFPNTRLSVLERLRSPEPDVRREAFGQIASAYWKAVYKYLRLKWQAADDDAADLTQGFLARALEKDFFEDYDPRKSRFRTFLRVCLDRFVMNERQAARAQRRGGGAPTVPLDVAAAEAELAHQDPSPDADTMLDREFLRELIGRTAAQVREECERSGRVLAFRAFERYDLADRDTSYAELAAELGVPVTQITNYLAAVRRMFRARVLENLRAVSGSEAEYRADARELLGIEVA